MANRRYNIDPQLRDIESEYATASRSARNIGVGPGQYLSNQQGLASQRARSIGQAYAQKNNMDNAYIGEQAQMRANFGQQRVQAKQYASEYNAMTDSAKRKFVQQGMSDLSQFAQNQKLMGNQKSRDQLGLSIINSMMKNYQINPMIQQKLLNEYGSGKLSFDELMQEIYKFKQ
jgi:hypothetical protein